MTNLTIPVISFETALPPSFTSRCKAIFESPSTAGEGDIVGLCLDILDQDNGVEVIAPARFISYEKDKVEVRDIDALGDMPSERLSGLHEIVGRIYSLPGFSKELADALEDVAESTVAPGWSEVWIFDGGIILAPKHAAKLFSPGHFTSKAFRKIPNHFRIVVDPGGSAHECLAAKACAIRMADFFARYVLQPAATSPVQNSRRNIHITPDFSSMRGSLAVF